jgi:hypothetical protein
MPAVHDVRVTTRSVPTEDGPESDGTPTWDHTGVVLVEVRRCTPTPLRFDPDRTDHGLHVRDR